MYDKITAFCRFFKLLGIHDIAFNQDQIFVISDLSMGKGIAVQGIINDNILSIAVYD